MRNQQMGSGSATNGTGSRGTTRSRSGDIPLPSIRQTTRSIIDSDVQTICHRFPHSSILDHMLVIYSISCLFRMKLHTFV